MDEYYEIRDMFVFFGLSITETFSTPDELIDILMKSDGDIIKKDLYQVSTAVSEGAIAGVSLNKEINGR